LQIIRDHAQRVSGVHGRGLDAMPLGDSGINNQLIKWHLLINRRVSNASASYFIGWAWYFHHKIFYITKLL